VLVGTDERIPAAGAGGGPVGPALGSAVDAAGLKLLADPGPAVLLWYNLMPRTDRHQNPDGQGNDATKLPNKANIDGDRVDSRTGPW